MGKGATVPVPGQILREYSGLSDQDWHETGGSKVEATDMRSLLGEGEQRYQYSLLYGGTDRQLLYAEAEPLKTVDHSYTEI